MPQSERIRRLTMMCILIAPVLSYQTFIPDEVKMLKEWLDSLPGSNHRQLNPRHLIIGM